MTSKLAIVAELCSPLEATVLREELEEAGIECHVDNAEIAGTFGQLPALGGVQIQVATEDEAQARRVIETARRRAQQALRGEALATQPGTRRPAWTCLVCGEPGSEQMDVCWSCGASRDGVPDPDFQRADEATVTRAQQPGTIFSRNFRRGVAVAFLLLGTLFFLTDATRLRSDWFTVALWLAMWGVAAALWPKREEPNSSDADSSR